MALEGRLDASRTSARTGGASLSPSPSNPLCNLHEALQLPQIIPYRPNERALCMPAFAVGAGAVAAPLAGAHEDAAAQGSLLRRAGRARAAARGLKGSTPMH